MNKLVILSAAGAIAVAGVAAYALARSADAQDAPGATTSEWAHGWQSSGRDSDDGSPNHHRYRMMAQRDWGLFYPVADKNLSVADVQTIAQAILLRHGNHTWKVANVTPNQDNSVSFAFTTADGDIVVRFAIDTQTGRLRRIG